MISCHLCQHTFHPPATGLPCRCPQCQQLTPAAAEPQEVLDVYEDGEIYEDATVAEEVYDAGEVFELDENDADVAEPDEDDLPDLPISAITGQISRPDPPQGNLHDTVGAGEEIPVLPASAIVNRQADGPTDEEDVYDGGEVVGGNSSSSSTVFKGGESIQTAPVQTLAARPVAAPQPGQTTAEQTRPDAAKPGLPGKKKQGARPTLTGRRNRAAYLLPVITGLSLVAAVVVCIGAYIAFPPETPEQRWDRIKELYTDKQWTQATAAFKQFAEDFPASPRTAEVPFFLAMCEAGPHVFSVSGDLDLAWKTLQQVFHDHRDNPAYNDYAVDLYLALIRVAERHIKYATASSPPDAGKLKTGAEALELARTVTRGIDLEMNDWIAPRTAQVDKLLAGSRVEVKTETARQQVVAILTRLATPEPGANVDRQYQQARELIQNGPPALADDAQLAKLWTAAYQAEAARVRYVPDSVGEEIDQPPLPPQAPGRTYYPVWSDGRLAPSRPEAPPVVFSVARGVLYAFSPTGRAMWQLRLGIDSYDPPQLVDAGEGTGEVALVVSTAQRSLLALDPATGRVRWQYRPYLQVTAAPLIVELPRAANARGVRLALLPAGNQVHVLELSRGRRLGVYHTGQPMTVGGAISQADYDPSQPDAASYQLRQLAFFPADTRRVFALNLEAIENPDAVACSSVLLTGHDSGSVRSAPVVISSQAVSYFVMTMADGLDRTKLRAFRLGAPAGFRRPDANAVTDVQFDGWSWFRPSMTADRIAVVSDAGDLGVYGVNLDNAEEGVYPMVVGKDGAVPRLEIDKPFRALAIHSDENFLWLLAGGRLQKIFLDVIHQKIQPLWDDHPNQAIIAGAAAHRAQLDRWGRTFYLTTMSEHGEKYELSAVDADSGEVLWQRQLGMTPAGDPLVLPKGVLVFDRTGRTNGLPLALLQKPRANIVRKQKLELPREASASRILRIKARDDQLFTIARLGEESQTGGDEDVAVRRYQPNGGSGDDWLPVHIPGGISGRPAAYGDFLFACCGDGHMRRFDVTTGMPAAATYKWTTTRHSQSETADVFALAADDVLVFQSRRVVRLKYVPSTSEWRQVGMPFEVTSPLTPQPVLLENRLLIVSRSGEASLLELDDLRSIVRFWDLTDEEAAGAAAEVTAGPVQIGANVYIVLNRRQLVCLDVDAETPLWRAPVFRGAVTGTPQLYGEMLLVSDESGAITALNRQTGQVVASHQLGPGVAPAAAAVPLASGNILAPLTDGGVRMLPPLQAAVAPPMDTTDEEKAAPAETPAADPMPSKEPGATAG